jgi:hypothetical protein
MVHESSFKQNSTSADIQGSEDIGDAFDDLVKKYEDAYSRFETNRFTLRYDDGSPNKLGVFPNVSLSILISLTSGRTLTGYRPRDSIIPACPTFIIATIRASTALRYTPFATFALVKRYVLPTSIFAMTRPKDDVCYNTGDSSAVARHAMHLIQLEKLEERSWENS